MIHSLRTKWIRASALVFFGFSLSACGGGAQEPKTPEERIAEDEEKLEDMEKEGVGSGSELDAQKIEKDMEEAEQEEQDTAPGEAME